MRRRRNHATRQTNFLRRELGMTIVDRSFFVPSPLVPGSKMEIFSACAQRFERPEAIRRRRTYICVSGLQLADGTMRPHLLPRNGGELQTVILETSHSSPLPRRN